MEERRPISPHFAEHEVACRCGCGFLVIVPKLVTAMEIVRALVQKPVIINSWCRCAKHNTKVGGEPDSQHLRGLAVDWRVKGFTPEMLYKVARQISVFRDGGIGLYPGFIHTDAATGGPRRWGPLWRPELDK